MVCKVGGIIYNIFKVIVSFNIENNLRYFGIFINVILNKNKWIKGLRI